MDDIYCTYFDHNYLSRALIMIRSLRRFDASPIYVLALSDPCANILKALDLPGVTVIPLAQIEAAYPELAALKAERKLIEYYFTLTPFLPHYLFTQTQTSRINYIDADLYFFAPPLSVVDRLGKASVAITPHRFSLPYKKHAIYGRFNVGWISYWRCAEGLACLEKYRADCAAWCFDRLEDDRFSDQKYLDAWPRLYPSLKIIEHKGFNLALWNIQNYVMRERNGVFMVDDDPLIFYHCSTTVFEKDGRVSVPLPRFSGRSAKALIETVLTPYIRSVEEEHRALQARFRVLENTASGVRYTG
jgi:hypothetical protein